MKKVILKKINSFWILLLSFFYLEFVFKILLDNKIWNINLLNISLFLLFLSLILKLLSSFIKNENFNKIIFFIFLFLICFIHAFELTVYKVFGFYYDLSLLGATAQVMEFASEGIIFILRNIVNIFLMLIPFILSLIFSKYIDTKRISIKKYSVIAFGSLIVYTAFLGSLHLKKESDFSAYKLFYENHNIELSIKKLGVVPSIIMDVKRFFSDFSEEITILKPIIVDEVIEEKKYDYNNLNIDFNSLIANSSGSIKQMHEYFYNESGTLQNEYTGFFKDKNLILFMAESFNEIAVDENRTPTLYKLVNNGFIFKNFYTPTISSTIGGEFQELTGLIAANGFVSPWKSGNNEFPFGIATSFKKANFSTYAYHNHNYTFQNRHKYLKAIGFDNYKGCNNGLESLINCRQWPESDVEMIETTINDYINDEQFFVYYVTVSGHGDYSWGNAMSKKHRKSVENLEYKENVKAYLAAQVELDQALEVLINKLAENNRLYDTVIALVGDHYPYYLSLAEVNEAASYQKDDVVEINHSNFILWNNNMENVVVKKVGSQIDVLPTLYNIFGIKYDSRLIIGKDILSPEPGLAIFGNRSWVSDYGTYFSRSGEFIAKDNQEIDQDYVSNMNQIVANKTNMSKLILTNNYYKYIEIIE